MDSVFNTTKVIFADKSGSELPGSFYPPIGTVGQARTDDLEDPAKDVIRVRYPYGTTCIAGFCYHCRGRLRVVEIDG